jgi:hypothetical protein
VHAAVWLCVGVTAIPFSADHVAARTKTHSAFHRPPPLDRSPTIPTVIIFASAQEMKRVGRYFWLFKLRGVSWLSCLSR